jgi:uncharacterized membrane protein
MKKLALAVLFLAGPLAAHDAAEHAAKAAREAKAAVVAGAEKAGDAVKAGGQAVETATTKAVDATKAGAQKVGDAAKAALGEVVVQAEPMQAMKENALKHLHNKIVHFPIALGMFGALFLLLSYRYPSYKWPARVLLFFAGVGAGAAILTGEAQEAAFDGTSLLRVLAWHETTGKVVLVLLWGAFVLSFFEVTRKFFWLYALVLAGALLLSGGLGGILATS